MSLQPSRLQTQEQVLPAGKGTLSSAKDFWTKSQAWHYSALSDALELWALPHQKYHRKLSTGSTRAVMKCTIIEFIFCFLWLPNFSSTLLAQGVGAEQGTLQKVLFLHTGVSPKHRICHTRELTHTPQSCAFVSLQF